MHCAPCCLPCCPALRRRLALVCRLERAAQSRQEGRAVTAAAAAVLPRSAPGEGVGAALHELRVVPWWLGKARPGHWAM